MRSLLLLLLTYSCLSTSYSQIAWVPQSAKWTYSGNGQTISYIEIEYVQDTLVLEKQSKVLKKTKFTYRNHFNDVVKSSLGHEITYEEDSVVYLYNYGRFDTLYNFNSNINDSWKLNCCAWGNCSATVKDTGTVIINGQYLKFIAVEYDFDNEYPWKVNDTIIERIGTTNMYFLPCDIIAGQLDGNQGNKLRCYSDNDLGTYSNNFEKPCDFLTSIGEYFESNRLKVYPIPCSENLNIEFSNYKDRRITISDLSGKVWFTEETSDLKCTIKLLDIPKGLFILSISSTDEIIHKKFIIK